MEDLSYKSSMVQTWKIEQEDRIRIEERMLKSLEIAKNAKESGLDIELIMKITGLQKKEIDKL